MASLPRDDNFVPGILVLGSATGADVVVEGDETTKGMNVQIVGDDVGIGGGTQYAEDTAHVSGDEITMAGVVQKSADAALSGDGDRSVMQVDENGYLKVNIKAGAGSGGTASDDDSAFVAGTGSGTPAMGFFSADTVDAGDVGVLAMDASRRLLVSIEADNAGIGGGTQYATNVAYADGNTGTLALTVRDDTLGALTEADGDYSTLRVDSTGRLWANVSNTVTVDLGANNDVTLATLPDTAAGDLAAQTTDLAAIEVLLGTIDSDTSGILTAVQLIDNAISGAGFNITQLGGAAVPIGAGLEATALRVTLATDSTGVVSIDDNGGAITVDGSLTSAGNVTNAGTFAVQAAQSGAWSLSANQSVNVAQMNGVATTMGNGTSGTGVQRVTIASDSTGQVKLAAGTAAIGKLTANSGVDIGDVDVTSLPALAAGTNSIGKILPTDIDVTAHTNYARKYYTSATPTDGIIWSPAAGKRWHVVTMYINVSAASTITLEDDKAGGDDPVWKGEIAANSGVVLQFPEKYPMASGEDAADLTITATAGTVYVTCVGYEV